MEEAALELEHGRVVRPWLDLIDHLRSQGVGSDLPLPQIAVMGDQSCGKSSVLEAISGIPFPRGSGLVTRCATQLTMKTAPEGCGWDATARTSTKGGQARNGNTMTLKSPDEVSSAISQLQDKLTKGNRHSFSLDHIEIFVRGPGLPDLTLIDLPGIVRTHIAGQRANVVQDVNRLIESFLVQDRTIILAVVPANQDIATVDILERAKKVDPEGKRTIGVVTKPDLVGPGGENEVIAVLKNIRKPLKLGYVVVRCRSQADIDAGLDMKDAAAAEQSFFRSNSAFASLPSDVMGVSNLTQQLTDLLVSRIEQALPSIKWELESQLTQTDKELKPMLKGVPLNTSECHTSLMRIVSDYCRLLRQSARGFYRDDFLSSRPKLRLHSEYQVIFRKLQDSIASTLPNFDDPKFVDEISSEIQSLKGKEPPGFINLQVFYSFIVQNVELWRPAVEMSRASITNATLEVTSLLIDTIAVQYPKLSSSIRELLSRLVEELSEDVSLRIDDLLSKESDPFTTNDTMLDVMNSIRFNQFDAAIEEALNSVGDKGPSKLFDAVQSSLGDWYMRSHGVNSTVIVNDMCALLQAYWHVATKRLVDNVCMTMEKDFFSHLVIRAEEELFLISSKVKSIDDLFIEDSSIVEKRRALQAKRNRLQEGLQKMNEKAAHIIAEKPSSQWEDVLYEDLHRDGSTQRPFEPQHDNAVTSVSLSSPRTTSGGETWKQKGLIATMNDSNQINELVRSAGRRARGIGSAVRGSPTSVDEKYSDRILTVPYHQQQQTGHYSPPIPPDPPISSLQAVTDTSSKPPQPFAFPERLNSGSQRQQQHEPMATQVTKLVDMGFPRESAVQALAQNGNNLEMAANWLIASKQGQQQTWWPPPSSASTTLINSNTVPVLVPTPAPARQIPSSLMNPVVPGSYHETQRVDVGGSIGSNTMAFSPTSNVPGMGGGGGGTESGGNLQNFLDLSEHQQQQQQTIVKNNPAVAAGQKTRHSRLKQSRAKYSSLFGDDGQS